MYNEDVISYLTLTSNHIPCARNKLKCFQSVYAGLDLLMQAIEKAGYTGKIKIGMDVAASEFCKEGPKYDLDFKNPNSDPKQWVSVSQ